MHAMMPRISLAHKTPGAAASALGKATEAGEWGIATAAIPACTDRHYPGPTVKYAALYAHRSVRLSAAYPPEIPRLHVLG